MTGISHRQLIIGRLLFALTAVTAATAVILLGVRLFRAWYSNHDDTIAVNIGETSQAAVRPLIAHNTAVMHDSPLLMITATAVVVASLFAYRWLTRATTPALT